MEIDNTAYTILVIDDDAPSLKAVIDHLQAMKFKTLAARSGERGLDVARRSHPDLILLDVLMPGIDGFETCRRLKADEATQNTPVIFLTALTDTTDKIKGFEAGAVDYITKPIQNQEVSVRIRTHLQLHELTQHLEKKVQEQTQKLTTEIAERKQLEKVLQENEARYRAIIESQVDLISRYLPDTTLTFVNDAYCEFFGKTREELIGHSYLFMIAPEFRDLVRQETENLAKSPKPLAGEYLNYRHDGKECWIQWVVQCIADEKGQVVELQAVGRDITERKQAEQLLQESEERYRRLAENAKDVIYRMSLPDGQYEYISPASVELFGYTPEEFYNAPKLIAEVIHPAWQTYFVEQWDKLMAGNMPPVYEYQIINRSGEVKWLHQRNVLIKDNQGKPTAIEGIVTDITQRVQIEEEVRRQNLELTLINRIIAASTTSPDAETILGIVCRELALTFDPAQTSATLWNEEKLRAIIVAEYRLEERPSVLNQDIPIEDIPIIQYLRTNKTPLVIEDAQQDSRLTLIHELLRERGTVSLLILPLIINQEVIGSLHIGTLEPRSFSNEEINLAQRVTEQVAGTLARIRLNEQHRQLEGQLRQSQKMEAIGRLAGGMAHDFNNLLTVITGYSELVLHRHVDKNDPLYRDIEQIRKAGDRATALTRQLLAFSRQQVMQREVLDLNTIITEMHKMLRRLVSEDIELITDLDPALGQIKVDQGQIEQIIMNLVVNAGDAMPQGGQLITKTANLDVDQAYADRHIGLEPGSYVTLTISDTGMGMDAETQSQIFEPFFTTKEEGKGTGLGLATVYGIVQQNQGYIEVSSRPKQGTTFQIYLPRFRQNIELTHQKQTSPDESAHGTETILLVEDEDMVRELARYTLQQDGYKVLEARHGQEALNVCKQYQEPIHLLLTDVVMPGGMSGHDLAGQLVMIIPDLKILYMSGYVEDAIAQRGIMNSDAAFVQKPFSPHYLSQKVREVLDTQVGSTTTHKDINVHGGYADNGLTI